MKMKKLIANSVAILTFTLSTLASAEIAFVAETPNNSIANEALGRAVSRPSCDDPFVAPVCARNNLFSSQRFFRASEMVMSFNQAVTRTEVNGDSAVGAVVDRGSLYVFENRSTEIHRFIPQTSVDLNTPPTFISDEVLENPLPAAAPILIAGLAALGLFSRRRRSV